MADELRVIVHATDELRVVVHVADELLVFVQQKERNYCDVSVVLVFFAAQNMCGRFRI